MSAVLKSHIHLDDRGVAWIDDTNVKVIEVAEEMLAHGLSADEIFSRHDGYLSMSQIHAALSHYFDNQNEIDAEIKRHYDEYVRARAASLDSPGRRKLKARGLIQ